MNCIVCSVFLSWEREGMSASVGCESEGVPPHSEGEAWPAPSLIFESPSPKGIHHMSSVLTNVLAARTALTVFCSYCDAPPGIPCRTSNDTPAQFTHARRLHARIRELQTTPTQNHAQVVN